MPEQVTVRPFGALAGGQGVDCITLKSDKLEVELLTYGATIRCLRFDGVDVALGFDSIEGYTSKDNPYFGCVVGRVANRVSNASFTLDGRKHQLDANVGKNALHGGTRDATAFDKMVWSHHVADPSVASVTFSLTDPDGSNGYPGTVLASVTYSLVEEAGLLIEYSAVADKATPINLTNHCYFNLAGHSAAADTMLSHVFAVPQGDKITTLDPETLVPTGKFLGVEGTMFDLRKPKTIEEYLGEGKEGFAINFCLGSSARPSKLCQSSGSLVADLAVAATVEHPESGRTMTVETDQPGVQFYTANFVPTLESGGLPGKASAVYSRQSSFCLETQDYPDAVNHETFPKAILRPGFKYERATKFAFGKKK